MNWRQSPHDTPRFADSEVLTLALLQGCLGVASLKQTYRSVAANYRSAFPRLCSYQQWMARLHALTGMIGALLQATTQQLSSNAAFYLIDAKPIPVCHPVRHRRVRLLREEGAWFGKTSKGWFFGFKLHVLRHIDGRIVNLVLTPGNWMTGPRRWPCWKVWRAASPSAISATGVNNEPRSGPRKQVCWFSHALMPRRKSTCWPRCGKASRPRFRSYGTGFSTVSFRVPGVVCGTRSNCRSFTTISAMPTSSLDNELRTGVRSDLHEIQGSSK